MMKLYDFSYYANRRDAMRKARAASDAVVEVIAQIEKPGSIIQLKERMNGWFILHKEILKVASQ